MPSDWEDDEGLPEKRPEHPSPSHAPTRSQVIRRRLVAIGALALMAVAVVVVLASAGGGSDDKGSAKAATGAPKKAKQAKPESHTVTNSIPQADWKPFTGPVPILEYHVLGAPPEGAPYPELYVGRTDFEKQMDWLEEHKY